MGKRRLYTFVHTGLTAVNERHIRQLVMAKSKEEALALYTPDSVTRGIVVATPSMDAGWPIKVRLKKAMADSKPKAERPNCVHLRSNIFLLRTQAGFRKAVKQFWGKPEEGEMPEMPKSYPTIAFFSIHHNAGLESLGATYMHVNAMLSALEGQ
jgi:hypothetical protein